MLYQKFVKQTYTKAQKNHCLFTLVTLVGLLLFQHVGYSQQYVIVDTENGDRLTGTWLRGDDTHFEIEYQGQILKLPLMGHTLHFTSDIANVPDRTAAKYYQNGLALLELKMPVRAMRRFEAAIEEFPRYPAAHYQLGLLHEANGDTAEALERFRSVAILDASNFDLVPHFQELGNTALANEAYAEAVDNYQLILRYYPEHESVPDLSYITGFLLVEELKADNEGLTVLESAVERYPHLLSHEKALFLIGTLQARTDQLENALHTLHGFILRYPVSEWVYEARLTRAEVNLQLDRSAEAENEVRQVLEMTTDEAIKERAKKILDRARWTVYTVAEGLPDDRVQAIAADETQLWVGTPNGVMLFETAFDKWIAKADVSRLINDSMEKVPDVRSIVANNNEVWIGTRTQGAIHYNTVTREIQKYLPTVGFPAWVKDIKMDDTEIWFATDGGVVRKMRGTADALIVYNRRQSFIPADNIDVLLLTPKTVWGASADGEIVTFDREAEEWDPPYRSTEISEGTRVIGFDTAKDQLLFTWFNAAERSNGYFRSDLDGLNGKSTSIDTGIENENALRHIYIRSAVDNTPGVSEGPGALPVETPESFTSEPALGTEALEVQPPRPVTPLVLWIATNTDFYTHRTRSGKWEDTATPQIDSDGFSIHALSVANSRVWIATSNGLATMKLE